MAERILVSVELRADLARAWKVFTDPEEIVAWNFASEDWRCPWANNDLRPGGAYVYRMESADGRMGFDYSGRYTRVVAGSEIESRLDDGRLVLTRFRELGGGRVAVSTEFEAEGENSLELQRGGWQAILDNYKKRVESPERGG